MAEMLPAVPSGRTRSEAERHLFGRLRTHAPADWTVLHSLGLRRHGRKPWAEADLVILTGDAIVVVEVKGGDVRRDGRVWTTNGKELEENPFDQAAGAAAALFDELRSAVPDATKSLIVSAVAFPDVEFSVDGADLVPEIVYDARDRSRPVELWLERVVDHWRDRVPGGRTRRGLDRGVRGRVIHHLAGDFDLRRSLRPDVDDVERSLVRLTERQAEVLRSLRTNERILVSGGAGTGKTWIAVEEAVREAGLGRKVLLLCHTRVLAAWLRRRVEDVPGVRVEHWNGLTSTLIRDAGLRDRLRSTDKNHLFRHEHPEVALEALTTLGEPPVFDVVIVDEAQDILTVSAVHLLDGLVLGGLAGGTWRLFHDPQQDILSGTERAALELVQKLQPVRFTLDTNCRNTAEIATQTAVMAGCSLEASLPVDGPQVDYLPFADDVALRKRVAAQLNSWLDGGLRPDEIVVLSLRNRQWSVLADGMPRGVSAPLVDLDEGEVSSPRGIRFATVANFKGLEAEAVLLLDVGRLPPGKGAGDIYVAMSRAKTFLAVGIHQDYEPARERLFAEFGRRLVASVEAP